MPKRAPVCGGVARVTVDPIRVAFGTSVLAQGLQRHELDGIGHYSRELLECFRTQDAIHAVPFTFGDAAPSQLLPSPVDVGRYQRQAALGIVMGRSFSGFAALEENVDLVHATDHMVPRLGNTPVVATLMDAIPLSHPEWVGYRFKKLKNALWRRSFGWADRILTISHYSRQEIVRHFGIPAERIDVIPLGVNPRWFNAPTPHEAEAVAAQYRLPAQYFLFIGTLQPRKNLLHLLESHAALPTAVRRACPLIVVGRAGWGCDEEVRRLSAADPAELRWLNYVADKDLPVILGLSRALVFPSLAEGFGLPILEAFAAGTPVIASNTSSIPEVAGDAALLVNPADREALTQAMLRISREDGLVQELSSRGAARARTFSWERTAAETLSSYRKLL